MAKLRWVAAIAAAGVLVTAGAAQAGEFDLVAASENTSGVQLKPTRETPPWGSNKDYLVPALEILTFQALLNRFDHAYFGCCDFNISSRSISRNWNTNHWVTDRDTFTVNQLGHPYQGSMYFNFARSAGLNFWEGLAYAYVGSATWEVAWETTRPSRNDQINTTLGGAFLGEALFRMSNLWLEKAPVSRTWKELGAAAISPGVGFNRLAFGERFRGIYPSNNPEYYSRLAIGVSAATQNDPAGSRDVRRYEGLVDFGLDYGLPGRPGYEYRRPFDYFAFEATAATGAGFERVATRGLLFGTDYGRQSKTIRGIWGLYGSYDYMAPQVFRLASSAVSVGTTLEWRPSSAFAVQGTALGGVGYATVSGFRSAQDLRDNNYGVAPQAALVLRLIFGERAAIDLSAREFYVSKVSGSDRGGNDNVVRADAAFTWRIQGPHAISLRYQYSRRDANIPNAIDIKQDRSTIGIFYTLLGRDRFGMGDWK